MSNQQTCQKCGARIAEASNAAICPACVLEIGLGSEDLARGTSSSALFPEALRYRKVGLLGEGGMGLVYEVEDLDLGCYVALKVFRSDRETGAVSAETIDRFLAEARITAQLDHASIPPVHDIGVDERGVVFFTMKLVKGMTFASFIDSGGEEKAWLAQGLRVLVAAGQAVGFAHGRGVVHRDLKPENIMMGDSGQVYVMDWGIARVGNRDAPTSGDGPSVLDAPHPHETRAGAILGSPTHMAPEQRAGNGAVVDAKSDIYALGSILRALLKRFTEIEAHRPGAPRKNARAPAALQAIVDRATSASPADRYGAAEAFVEDLQAWLDRRVVRAYRTGPWQELRSWIRRNRAAAGGALFAVSALGLGLMIATGVQTRANREYRRLHAVNEIANAGESALAGNLTEARRALAALPDELGGWERRFLDGFLNQWSEEDSFEFLEGQLESSSFSAEGRYVAAIPRDRSAIVVAGARGERRMDWPLPSTVSAAFALFAPDGDRLVCGVSSDGTSEVWIHALDTDREVARVRLDREIDAMAWDEGAGVVWIVDGNGALIRWDATERRALTSVEAGSVYSIAGDLGNGRLFLGFRDGSIRVHDPRTGSEIDRMIAGHKEPRLRLSRDGRYLVTSTFSPHDNTHDLTTVWDLAGSWSRTLPGSATYFIGAFDRDVSRFVAGTEGGRVLVWDTSDWRILHSVRMGRSWTSACHVASDGRVYHCDGIGRVSIWRFGAPSIERRVAHERSLRFISFLGQGERVISSGLGDAIVWDAASARPEDRILAGSFRGVPATYGMPGGSSILYADKDSVYRKDVSSGKRWWRAPFAEGNEAWWLRSDLAERRVLSCGDRGVIDILDAESGSLVSRFDLSGDGIMTDGADISPDGERFVVLRRPETLELWHIDSRRREWSSPTLGLRGAAFSSDGQWVANGCSDGSIEIRRVRGDGRVVRRLIGHENSVAGVAFHPTEPRLFSAGRDGYLRVWDPIRGDRLLALPMPHQTGCWDVDVSADGQTVVVADHAGGVTFFRTPEID